MDVYSYRIIYNNYNWSRGRRRRNCPNATISKKDGQSSMFFLSESFWEQTSILQHLCLSSFLSARPAKVWLFRGGGGGGGGGRDVPPRPDYFKSPKAKAREARRDPLVISASIYIYIEIFMLWCSKWCNKTFKNLRLTKVSGFPNFRKCPSGCACVR